MLQNTAQLPANLVNELRGSLTRLASLSNTLKTQRGDIVALGEIFTNLFPEQSLFGDLAGASPQEVEAANARYKSEWDKWAKSVDQASQATFQLSGQQLSDLQQNPAQFQQYMRQKAAQRQAKEAKDREWNSTTVDGKQADLSALNFNYEVKGKASWKPERVYDDGQQTFIRLQEKSKSGEMPVLLVRKGKQDVLVNYRVKDSAMIVDGLFERIALIIGVGGDQEKIEVVRGGK